MRVNLYYIGQASAQSTDSYCEVLANDERQFPATRHKAPQINQSTELLCFLANQKGGSISIVRTARYQREKTRQALFCKSQGEVASEVSKLPAFWRILTTH